MPPSSELIDRTGGPDGAEAIRFPPGMNRAYFETSGYMKSFPQLAGTVHSFCGCELDHISLLKCMEDGRDWTKGQEATDIVLTPAACYPLYPTIARRGAVKDEGQLYDLQSYCFRHEPSKDPARQQLFRMREYVYMGPQDKVMAFRQLWMDRGTEMMKSVGLPVEIDGQRSLLRARRQDAGQQPARPEPEIRASDSDHLGGEADGLHMSFNYHQDQFGIKWGLKFRNDNPVHTACVGFGLERIALARFPHARSRREGMARQRPQGSLGLMADG